MFSLTHTSIIYDDIEFSLFKIKSEIVDEQLIALKSIDKVKDLYEDEQCYLFVVKSKKLNLLSKSETISQLLSYTREKQLKIATQIMKLISKSGLGDVGFHNFYINRDTNKLVIVDTEPLYGSLFLNEKGKYLYSRTDLLRHQITNDKTVKQGFKQIKEQFSILPIFEEVSKIYIECFLSIE